MTENVEIIKDIKRDIQNHRDKEEQPMGIFLLITVLGVVLAVIRSFIPENTVFTYIQVTTCTLIIAFNLIYSFYFMFKEGGTRVLNFALFMILFLVAIQVVLMQPL